jgi:hypothetical protein
MLVLLFGIAAIVGTVVLGAYAGESWLHCWEGVGEIREDCGEIRGQVDRVSCAVPAAQKEEALWSPGQALGECAVS